MDFVYVCSLVGNDVFSNNFIVGVITRISDINKVKEKIKAEENIEFEELSSHFCSSYLRYENITDSRDVSLIVERVYFL